MKKIEFIAPVEAMRGNLSGSQTLLYATRNNPAWDAPEGDQAAKNYTPRYVGAKRARGGLKYFAVRKSSVTKITSKTREIMALLAGSSACFIAASRNLMIYTELRAAFLEAKASDQSLTFRKWLQGILYVMLANKQGYAPISFKGADGTTQTIKVGNPWVAPGAGVTEVTELTIPQDILVKFWTQLAVGGFNFELAIAGGRRIKGIAYSGLNWETMIESDTLNVLGLVIDTDDNDAIKYNGLYVLNVAGDDLVDPSSNIAAVKYPVSGSYPS